MTVDTTVFKTFANFSHLVKLTANQKWHVELSNGYFTPVLKCQLKKVANSMVRNGETFTGQITVCQNNAVQITVNN